MRDGFVSDSYRLFGLLSKLCQSPVSWYTSGPAQKYILRQIKGIDADYMASDPGIDFSNLRETRTGNYSMDVCLLMLYGHILFTSTSYTYAIGKHDIYTIKCSYVRVKLNAIGYFLRALALDPDNPMIHFSLGLSYVHYGMKRQSTNRQYLLLQGQSFIANYLAAEGGSDGNKHRLRSERCYNVGRVFQLLGLGHLSASFYDMAKKANREDLNQDVGILISFNTTMAMVSTGNHEVALCELRDNIVL